MRIDGEMVQALEDLAAAHVAHKAASEAFLSAQLTSFVDDTVKVASEALTRAQLRVGEEGSNVAILAMQRGIKPSKES